MSNFQHNRDGVLDGSERAASARKCLEILEPVDADDMRSKDADFYRRQVTASNNVSWQPSEPVLQWLRDLVERYVTS